LHHDRFELSPLLFLWRGKRGRLEQQPTTRMIREVLECVGLLGNSTMVERRIPVQQIAASRCLTDEAVAEIVQSGEPSASDLFANRRCSIT
jgi:hypothetical protein